MCMCVYVIFREHAIEKQWLGGKKGFPDNITGVPHGVYYVVGPTSVTEKRFPIIFLVA